MAIKPDELSIDVSKQHSALDIIIEHIDSQFKNETHSLFEFSDSELGKHFKIFEVILKLDKILTTPDMEYISNAYTKEGWTECNIWYNRWTPHDPNSRISMPPGTLIFQLVKE